MPPFARLASLPEELIPRLPASSHTPSLPPAPTPTPAVAAQHAFALAQRLLRRIPLPHPPPLQRLLENLRKRQTAVIPTVYKIDGPAPGAVAGIVLGSVAGFIVLILLLLFLTNTGPRFPITGQTENIVRVDDRSRYSRPPSTRQPRKSRRSSHSRSERIVEIRERSPRIQPMPMRTTIVEETTRRVVPPPPQPRPPPAPAPPPDSVSERIVSERVASSRRSSRGQAPPPPPPPAPPSVRRVEGDDIVEVIEDGSSYASPSPRRERRTRRTTASGGYRSVDPELFAGGNYPQIPIYGHGSVRRIEERRRRYS